MYSFDQRMASAVNKSGTRGWLVSILELGAWFGVLCTGYLADKLSRKYTILLGALSFNIRQRRYGVSLVVTFTHALSDDAAQLSWYSALASLCRRLPSRRHLSLEVSVLLHPWPHAVLTFVPRSFRNWPGSRITQYGGPAVQVSVRVTSEYLQFADEGNLVRNWPLPRFAAVL